ncbi:hypothetical protein M8J76_003952 [Diaphorina citri]|nr:hypothetical protein M8J76_003952 [Diaphorina citri]KAI5742911.1 hypothetical protein M8J77_012539 [Diaphorina citri]
MKSNISKYFVTVCFIFLFVDFTQAEEQKNAVVPHILYAPVPPLLHLAPAYAPPATDEVHCAPNQQYILPHSVYCDRFYSCDNGTPVMYQCEDGYAFHPEKQECKLLHLVKCGSRTKLQTPQGKGLCQRLNGLYADRVNGCEKYVNCGNGTAYPTACPGGLVFDDYHKYCKEPTDQDAAMCNKKPLVLQCADDPNPGFQDTICSTFKCPITNKFPFGDHARYPNPVDCKSFIICLRDGTAKVHGCPDDMLFSNIRYVCVNATQAGNECYDSTIRT